MVLTNGADPAEIPGYADLPAVAAGAALEMDYAAAVALNTPTPLSIPYALDLLRPALEAAAA
jgi:iron complex transport system substrate-binding protein